MRDRRMSDGMRALFLVVGSVVSGVTYFQYLSAEPFPPNIVRLVPIAWLTGSVLGARLAVRALRGDRNRMAAGLALILSVPSTVLAAVFTMAALMGD